jgi:hypothetical protein
MTFVLIWYVTCSGYGIATSSQEFDTKDAAQNALKSLKDLNKSVTGVVVPKG